MGEGPTRCVALLACTTLLAIFTGFAPGTAAADSTDPGSSAEQTSSSSASSSAQNDNSTTQSATATQSGAGTGGQSQTIVQEAPTQQSATASATSTQKASNVSTGGSASQHNVSAAVASANNANHTDQSSVQQQNSGDAPPPDPAPGQAQTSSQSAPVSQKENAKAASKQVAPTNVNVVIRIDSPGSDGPVTQSNTSVATAVGDNSNATTQDAAQNQTGGGASGGQSQSTDQSAPTSQSANTSATSTQVAPLNANIVIRNKSPGDSGPVAQTNSSQATAQAANGNTVNQSATQTQTLAGDGPTSGQSQSVSQSAPTVQGANATAVSTQSAPTNANIAILIDGAASDPSGSGALGTLIQIWIPLAQQQAPDSNQANTSSATASAENTNQVAQSATQLQSGSSDGGSQLGGVGQSQTIVQSAPTTQTANAQAVSEQAGASGSSSATATQENSNQTAQRAQQTGPGVQVIEQAAPSIQSKAGTAMSATRTKSRGRDGWNLAFSFAADPAQWSAPDRRSAAGSPAPSRRSHSGAHRHQVPFPHAPDMPNASLGGSSPTGGSPAVFAMLLLGFALTAPWWARRRLPSAFRRLMAVASRLERPG
jgi:trimeric autotransporter adhesin